MYQSKSYLRLFGLLALLVVAVASPLRAADSPAKPFLHPLFSSDMVLQRGIADPIWGWTKPGATVTVKFHDQTATATADADGKWLAKVGPFDAGGPFDLTVSAEGQDQKLSNVMVGDVWLCSGQSNMGLSVNDVWNAKQEIASADHPMLRYFLVPAQPADEPREQFSGPAQWEVCTPKVVARFTAAGYFFGRDLQAKLQIPIGLIHSSWGGTICEAWTSAQALDQHMPDFKSDLEKEKRHAFPEKNPNVVTHLYNGMINPLIPFAIKGAIWYQGESNSGRGLQYRRLLPTMISDWRSRFGVGDFPFYIVQLANFKKPKVPPGSSAWAEVREAQAMTADTVGNSAIATAIDIGDPNNIHPKNKQEIGRRLALDALALTYGEKIEYSGPTFTSMENKGDSIVIHYSHAHGLKIKKGDQLKGFEISSDGEHFVPADAAIDGDTVVVKANGVNQPKAVRYDWADNPEGNLYNDSDLPAYPFRTNSPK